jgi:uroporphyrinogen decarboxylase
MERVKAKPVPLVLHLHGENIYFDTVNQYPVHAVSWHNHETGPTLEEAMQLTTKTLMTGLDRNLLESGQPDIIVRQAEIAIEKTSGKRLILAPACVIPTGAPLENLEALTKINRTTTGQANLPATSNRD